ncbi:MAG: ribosome maturation factor [Treponema sp.]|nr:ribosome maturation factor [Treponema sp.]
MEYVSLDSFPHYSDCASFVEGMGFYLVELHVTPIKGGTTHISAVIAPVDSKENLSVNDCTKVHRALQAHLEEVLGTEDTAMELSSPGMERNIKNAAEFRFFTGRQIRVWDKNITDWVGGVLKSADEKSLVLEVTNEDGSSVEKEVSFVDIAKAKFIHL